VLLVTPVGGVVTALVTFLREADVTYAAITAIVLAILAASFALAAGG
jgi:uncharacterized membrane protein